MRFVALVAAFLAVMSPNAYAQTPGMFVGTGNDMYQACKDVLDDRNMRDAFKQGQCNGIIMAIFYFGENLPSERRFCSPRGAGTNQALRIMLAYMDANPAKLHLPIFVLATDALRDAWPCGR